MSENPPGKCLGAEQEGKMRLMGISTEIQLRESEGESLRSWLLQDPDIRADSGNFLRVQIFYVVD